MIRWDLQKLRIKPSWSFWVFTWTTQGSSPWSDQNCSPMTLKYEGSFCVKFSGICKCGWCKSRWRHQIWWFVSIFSRIEGDGQPLPHESSWIRVYLHLLQVPFIMVGWPGVHMSCSLTMARMRPRHFDGWARRFLHDGALFAWGKQKPSLHEVYPKLKEIGWFPSKSKSLIQHRFC
jgi:hypothetical protein